MKRICRIFGAVTALGTVVIVGKLIYNKGYKKALHDNDDYDLTYEDLEI